ncbi:hypothetical protein COV19_01800 [Candidatus Woesearchaeota archaeon CG10_big_fil_rev_8_21_14_0_10_44_13]|nr:MAG: hypothetical protein COV19_01800 [Candidatus Woesearchaeota archaeon CG10_big_fil_rev_8_21_14_0_10_44_13]
MLKAYASYFASYLLANLGGMGNIKRIILFGSAARGEATKESDIDIFIEIKKENKKFTKIIEKMLDDFYESREALYFKAKKADNKINLIIGKLEEWKDLKKSIESTGIVLYGPYSSYDVKGRKYSMISWDSIGENRGAFLNKMYGVRINDKSYKGLVEKSGGRKIGKSSVMVPVENREDVIKLLRYHKVNARISDVYAE